MEKAAEAQESAFVPIIPDLLISGGTERADEFAEVSSTLAGLAWDPQRQTPFTALIPGGQGRDKHNLLRHTRRLLEATQPPSGTRQVRTLGFNAWKFPDDESVLVGLFGTLLNEFRQGRLLDQLRFQVDSHHTWLTRMLLHAAAPWAFAEPADFVDEVPDCKDLFRDLYRDLFQQAAYLLFHGTAVQGAGTGGMPQPLWDAQTRRKYALAIFFEDLDRCKQDRLLEVVEAIDVCLDLAGVSCFLDLERKHLQELLSEQLTGDQEAFLERLVQISPEMTEPGVSPIPQELRRNSALSEVSIRTNGNECGLRADDFVGRSPRDTERFQENLSYSLAMLGNTGCLGERPNQLHEPAVVAWHLLLENLSPEQSQEVRALAANLEEFLLRVKAAAETDNHQGLDKRGREAPAQRYWNGELYNPVNILLELNPRQLDLLVHVATPPREVPAEVILRPGMPLESSEPVFAEIEWVKIPGGTFSMGSVYGRGNEQPVHAVALPAFHIARYPVTNAQYARYVVAKGTRPPPHWLDGKVPEGRENHPVVCVSWQEALAYCDWLSEKLTETGRSGRVHLPSEAEWEYAARGSEGRSYPWGSEAPDRGRCNFNQHVNDTTSVGAYPTGVTPEGVYDLAGNVWEWTRSKWEKYPYPKAEKKRSKREARQGDEHRVLRGCSFRYSAWYVRSTCRGNSHPAGRHARVGFRVVRISL